MEKINIGKDVFCLSGRVTNTSSYETDANVGDIYQYIYVDDQLVQRFLVPHPLQLSFINSEPQDYYFTKFGKGHVLTAIRTSDGIKYASQLGKVGRWEGILKVLPVFLLLLSPLACAAGGPSGGGGPMLTLVVVASVFCFFAVRTIGAPNRAFRRVDSNVALLKNKFGA